MAYALGSAPYVLAVTPLAPPADTSSLTLMQR